MIDGYGYCLECSNVLSAIDADPDGSVGCTCARCLAEQRHDFDREPGAKFDRRGQRIDEPVEAPKVVYIAVPSAGVFTMGPEGIWTMSEKFIAVMAELHAEHPTWVFISPSAQNYLILHRMNGVSHSYEDWRARCRLLLSRCDIVLVMRFPGWEKSTGVQDEIQIARGLQKEIIFDKVARYV